MTNWLLAFRPEPWFCRRLHSGPVLTAMAATVLFLMLFWLSTQEARAEEVNLYNSSGEETAYVSDDLTVYLWGGKPVAYLASEDAGSFHVYRFEGAHLGWLQLGVIYDHDGRAVGATKENFRSSLGYESYKGFKQYKPLKGYKERPPRKPRFVREWSDVPFEAFLSGVESAQSELSGGSTGTIVLNEGRGSFIVQTGVGFCLMTWMGGAIPMQGDVLVGPIETLGLQDVYVTSRKETMGVFVEQVYLSRDQVISAYRRKFP